MHVYILQFSGSEAEQRGKPAGRDVLSERADDGEEEVQG